MAAKDDDDVDDDDDDDDDVDDDDDGRAECVEASGRGRHAHSLTDMRTKLEHIYEPLFV